MVKKKSKRNSEKRTKEISIPTRTGHLIAAGILIAAFVIFFHALFFGGKIFVSSDDISAAAYRPYVEKAESEGVFPLWTPYLFSGLPSYASMMASGDRWFDLIQKGFSFVTNSIRRIFRDHYVFVVIFFHILFACSLYALAYGKTKNIAASLFAALTISFCLGIIIWVMEGHFTKARSLISLPLLLLMAEQLRTRIKIWHILTVIVILHMHGSHLQMLYYSVMTMAIYYLFFTVRYLVKKENVAPVIKSAVVLALCAGFSFLMQADRYLSTYEYNQYSIRGVGPLEKTDEATGTPGGGLDYDYATNWSFSPQELTTFVIPSFYGFGTHTYRGELTQNQPVRVNTYFGQMPFTVAPVYAGIVLLFFAVVGMTIYRRDPFIQFLMVLSGFSLLVSFGRTLPVLYDLLYHYLPLFDKFRAPSMILILLHVALAIAAAYGVSGIANMGREKRPALPLWLRRILIVSGTLFILSFLARGVFESAYIGLIQASGKQIPPQLHGWIYDGMMADASFNIGLILIVAGLIALYLRGNIPGTLWAGALILVSIVDVWRVAYRPMEVHPEAAYARAFEPGQAVRFLQTDDDLYRVMQVQNNQALADNRLSSFFIQDIYGYHPAKIRIYQDMIDIAGIMNPFIWNILNVKYVLGERFYDAEYLRPVFDGDRKIMENTNRLPRLWFVGRVETSDPHTILHAMRDAAFDPHELAYLECDPEIDIDPASPESSARITGFGIHHLSADVRSEGNQFLVVSEVYYPAGWNAYLNGERIEIHKTNYFLRGVVIPPGEHTLEMRFEPRIFAIGKTLTLITNLLVVIFGIGLLAFHYKKKNSAPR